ncbi:MAG: hypothetical protein LLG04_05050 [Parachlamydia sp.]|nr:hypothetical protein [Parachlamydia sp.]
MFKLIFLLLVWWAPLSAWFDLEELTRSFVLDTKKIDIPGYPAAFNPSIIRWQGQLWMSFRSYDRATFPINTLGLIPLDECFNPSGVPQILDILGAHSGMDVRAQDIRLIAVGEALYIVYNRMDQQNKRRMCVAKLQKQAGQFVIEQPEYLTQFPDMLPERDEKNWVPFSYKDHLLLAYSLSPHRILSPIAGAGTCDLFAITKGNISWDWGELRGGTPALADGNHYLAFFHSCKKMETKQSQGMHVKHYLMGAYTFARHPPFQILRISPHPIIGSGFYEGDMGTIWRNMWVVFPGGLIVDEKFVWVVYGRQDREIWVVKMDKKGLLNSLVSVTKE